MFVSCAVKRNENARIRTFFTVNETKGLTPNVKQKQHETNVLKPYAKHKLNETKALKPNVKHKQHAPQDFHFSEKICV